MTSATPTAVQTQESTDVDPLPAVPLLALDHQYEVLREEIRAAI